MSRFDADHPHYKWVALSNTTLGMLLATINSSIVLISLPAIFRGIGLDPLAPGNVSYLLWMLMGYLLVTAVLRRHVRPARRHLRPGAASTTSASSSSRSPRSRCRSTRCTAAAGALWLIGWRVVQGIGGAMLFANSTAILTDAFPADQRGLALGHQPGRRDRRLVHRAGARRRAGRVGLARGVLGQRARSACVGTRLVVPVAARDRRAAPGQARLVGQRHLRASG